VLGAREAVRVDRIRNQGEPLRGCATSCGKLALVRRWKPASSRRRRASARRPVTRRWTLKRPADYTPFARSQPLLGGRHRLGYPLAARHQLHCVIPKRPASLEEAFSRHEIWVLNAACGRVTATKAAQVGLARTKPTFPERDVDPSPIGYLVFGSASPHKGRAKRRTSAGADNSLSGSARQWLKACSINTADAFCVAVFCQCGVTSAVSSTRGRNRPRRAPAGVEHPDLAADRLGVAVDLLQQRPVRRRGHSDRRRFGDASPVRGSPRGSPA
jgi:hypothetical protein